jgi:hypothetical protein
MWSKTSFGTMNSGFVPLKTNEKENQREKNIVNDDHCRSGGAAYDRVFFSKRARYAHHGLAA